MKIRINGPIGTRGIAVLIWLLALVCFEALHAEVSTDKLRIPPADKTQIITLNDGSKLMGRITAIEGDKITFSSQIGEMTIQKSQIAEIKEIANSSMRGGKYWFPNPNKTRLYFSPTGRIPEKGSGYFSDLLLFFPSIYYGISDNFSIGGGISLFPGVDFDKQLLYLFPQVGFKAGERLSVSGSVFILRIPQFDEDLTDQPKVAGILFGMATYGTDDASITFGLGDGYVDNDFAKKPAAMIGGEWRFARRLSFVSENWIFPDIDQPIISYGIRFFGENLSADLGLFTPGGKDAIVPGIPMVGFSWNF